MISRPVFISMFLAERSVSEVEAGLGVRKIYTTPYATIALATLRKPATFAPTT